MGRKFIEWLRYILHFTDWKQKSLVITYYTKRGAEANLHISNISCLKITPQKEHGTIYVDRIKEER